jgi:hypothetical protein
MTTTVVRPRSRRGRGHKPRPDLDALIRQKWEQHGKMLAMLPKATPSVYDCIALGIVGPIKDQAQCGSCWDFSGTGMVESAQFQAGVAKADGSFQLSEQYTLDCYQNGGCNGDDNTTVLDHAKSVGLPTTASYGPYTQQAGQCLYTSQQLYKIANWGFLGSQTGVVDVQSIKNGMASYGPIGCAIAADDAFENNPPGTVFQGSGSTEIDHDIILVGWDDSKGAWKLRNSWGTSWCDAGYCWIAYGANLVGTEAVWCSATSVVPPGPPVPPTPPAPPVPQTFTIQVPQQPVSIFGMTLGYVPATTLTGTISASGHRTITLPPWLVTILQDACAMTSGMPFPWSLLSGLCQLLPAKGTAVGQHVTITIPPTLLNWLQFICTYGQMILSPSVAQLLSVLCGFLPVIPPSPTPTSLLKMFRGGCGCK